MEDDFLLQRFVEAQKHAYENVVSELKAGQKRSCWMWFVFPQVVGLGRTATAEKYSIRSLAEAKAYLRHPLLGKRLHECTRLVVDIDGRTAKQIFGFPDELKFRSSMTLFKQVATDNQDFQEALDKFYDGREDQLTNDVLRKWRQEAAARPPVPE